jgi:hypothetical protein
MLKERKYFNLRPQLNTVKTKIYPKYIIFLFYFYILVNLDKKILKVSRIHFKIYQFSTLDNLGWLHRNKNNR